MKKIFEKMGAFLVERCKIGQSEKGNPGLEQELFVLSAGKKTAVKNYYIQKVSAFLMIITAGIILSIMAYAAYYMHEQKAEVKMLERPGYGENNRMEELTFYVNDQLEENLEVTIQAKKLTDEQKKQLLRQAKQELQELIAGENTSLQEIRTNLIFPEELQNHLVKVSWTTMPADVIAPDGTLNEPVDDVVKVEIQATMICENIELRYETEGLVVPPELTSEEILRQEIRKAVQQADEQEPTNDIVNLPEEVQNARIKWKTPSQNPVRKLLALTLLAAVVLWVEMDASIHKKAEQRRNQLMIEYPDLLWKMTMLLGAGLSLKGTFTRIAAEYKKKQQALSRKKEKRYVYEEVIVACYEMQSGVPEAEAYERFGRRCELNEYIRLGSVLSQNLKKGSTGLCDLLAKEAERSLNDRKNHAREMGEQAGTKMLLPMMLMLVIVLTIVMVPAILTF